MLPAKPCSLEHGEVEKVKATRNPKLAYDHQPTDVRPNFGNADIIRETPVEHGNPRRIHPTRRCEMRWRGAEQSSRIAKHEVRRFLGLGSSSTKTT